MGNNKQIRQEKDAVAAGRTTKVEVPPSKIQAFLSSRKNNEG